MKNPRRHVVYEGRSVFLWSCTAGHQPSGGAAGGTGGQTVAMLTTGGPESSCLGHAKTPETLVYEGRSVALGRAPTVSGHDKRPNESLSVPCRARNRARG